MNTSSGQLPDQGTVEGDRDRSCLEALRLRASFMPGGTTTYLIREGTGSEITKRELESAVAALDVDLESDQGVLISC
jgi:hypothetical protein